MNLMRTRPVSIACVVVMAALTMATHVFAARQAEQPAAQKSGAATKSTQNTDKVAASPAADDAEDDKDPTHQRLQTAA